MSRKDWINESEDLMDEIKANAPKPMTAEELTGLAKELGLDLDAEIRALHPSNPELGIMSRETTFFRSMGERTQRVYEVRIDQPEYGLKLLKRDSFPVEIEINGDASDAKIGIDTLIQLLEKAKETLG
jgi:hypothetical protein